MKITVIDNFDSFVFNLVRYLKAIPEVVVEVQRNNAIDYQKLEESTAILLSPGPGIPSEAGELMNIIDRFHTTKKILGICLGHQALGEYFGAELVLCSQPVHGKASQIHPKNFTPLFQGLEQPIIVGRYHSWILKNDLHDQLIATAELETGELMAFKHKNFDVEGLQFHPESILTPQGRKMIENWLNPRQKNKDQQAEIINSNPYQKLES